MRKNDARKFVKKNARPIDLAVYNYFFENKSSDIVIDEIRKYQNEDGGIGKGLEADYWNPNSSPIATNDALITLYKTHAMENATDILDGIIRYLKSHDSFDIDKMCWQFAIESNIDYPHAIWWEKSGDGISGYNPTISLATFLVCYSNRDNYYENIIRRGFEYLNNVDEIGSDGLKCYMLSYCWLKDKAINDIVNLEEYKSLIERKIEETICKDTAKYGKEYVPLPSDFFIGMFDEFITQEIRNLAKSELDVLDSLQLDDGGFDISWQWNTDFKSEFLKARDMWRPKLTCDKLLFVEKFGD